MIVAAERAQDSVPATLDVLRRILVGVCLTCLLCPGAIAGLEEELTAVSESSMERVRKDAEAIDRRLKASQAEVRSFSREEMETIESLHELELELNTTRSSVRDLERDLTTLEADIRASETTAKALSEKVTVSEVHASKRLVALYKLSWLGKTPVLASAGSISGIFHRSSALERVLAYDEEMRKGLVNDREELRALVEKKNVQIREKRSIGRSLEDHARVLSQTKTSRSALLADIRARKSLKLAAIEALKQAAAALNERMMELGAEAVHVEPAGTAGQKLFSSLKGLLNMPVKGTIVSRFGPYRNAELKVSSFRSGVDIKADRGEPIHAVCSGKVLYASWFKGYGNMLIINHGENYYTVYAHLEESFKSNGNHVEMGEVVATVGDTGSRIGPALHFEVRHHGKPVNPLIWIKKG